MSYNTANGIGFRAISLAAWTLVFVGIAFFVPDDGFRILLRGERNDLVAGLMGAPLLLLWSALPIAVTIELWIARRTQRRLPANKVAGGIVISVLAITAWGYGEPYFYLSVMHPNGFAQYETYLLLVVGSLLTVALFAVWRSVPRLPFSGR